MLTSDLKKERGAYTAAVPRAMRAHQLLQDLCAEEARMDSDENESRDDNEDPFRLQRAERLALAGNAWFAGLPAPIRHDLLCTIRVRPCAPREEIFAPGAPADAWMVCLTGAVRLATPRRNGRSVTLGFLGPGQWFGDLPTAATPRHMHHASAKGTTRIGEIARRAMSALLRKHPDFHAALLGWQSLRLASLNRLFEEHATLGLPARMPRQLYRLAEDHGAAHGRGEVRITLPLFQTELAELAGCSRQRANQQMVHLARLGVVRYEDGSYVVTDRERLQGLCGIEGIDSRD